MKEFFNIDVSQLSLFNFIWILGIGVLLWLFIQLFKKYFVYVLFKSPIKQKKIRDKLPLFEVLFWLLYAVYVLYLFIKPYPLLGGVIFLILVLFSRKPLNNLIQGLFIRFKGDLVKGQRAKIEKEEGTVHELNSFDLVLENKEGELVHIPYGELVNKKIVLKDISSNFFSDSFTLNTSISVSKNEIVEKIMELPWSFGNFSPKVTEIEEDGKKRFEILIYSIDRRYLSYIKNDIQVFFESN